MAVDAMVDAIQRSLLMSDEQIRIRIEHLESAHYSIGTEDGRTKAIASWQEWSALRAIQEARGGVERARKGE